ncbi:MAG: hypothetical protein C0432_01225 [Candidatus Puniceispirillum sp.]|nr:hypothetical protein [Candidatus Pelagibacter sp.]MBA4282903.1 hypothetical protein [Candidatus Puniceispirillum sp.]
MKSSQHKSLRFLLSELELLLYQDIFQLKDYQVSEKFLESLMLHFEVFKNHQEFQKIMAQRLFLNLEYWCDIVHYPKRVMQYLAIEIDYVKINSQHLLYEISKDYPFLVQLQLMKPVHIPISISWVWLILLFYGWDYWQKDESPMHENTMAKLNSLLQEIFIF